MTRGGFDFKKRRSWGPWGAHREWPAINPIGADPTLLSNTTASTTRKPTYAFMKSAVQTYVTAVAAVHTAALTITDASPDFASSRWNPTLGYTMRFPRSGIAVVSLGFNWAANAAGERFISIQSYSATYAATGQRDAYASRVPGMGAVAFGAPYQSVSGVFFVQGGDELAVQPGQNSGGNLDGYIYALGVTYVDGGTGLPSVNYYIA